MQNSAKGREVAERICRYLEAEAVLQEPLGTAGLASGRHRIVVSCLNCVQSSGRSESSCSDGLEREGARSSLEREGRRAGLEGRTARPQAAAPGGRSRPGSAGREETRRSSGTEARLDRSTSCACEKRDLKL